MSEKAEIEAKVVNENELPSKGVEKVTVIPKGMLKSGRVWKTNQTKKYKQFCANNVRSSQFATNGVVHIKTDWELKEEKRQKQLRTKELQKSMKEAKAEAQRVLICDFIIMFSKRDSELKNRELEEFRMRLNQHKFKLYVLEYLFDVDYKYRKIEEDEQEATQAVKENTC